MRGRDALQELGLSILSPTSEIAGGLERRLEDLGVVGGVDGDKPEPALLDLADGFGHARVVKLVMPSVTPPDQHIRGVQSGFADPLLRVVDGGGSDFQVRHFAKIVGNRPIDSIGVNIGRLASLGPAEDTNFGVG
jgi:hypothetical protein